MMAAATPRPHRAESPPRARPRPPEPEEYDDEPPAEDDYAEERPRRRRRRRSRGSAAASRLTAPAICLLITGILWLLFALFRTAITMAAGGPEALAKENAFQPQNRQDKEFQKNLQQVTVGAEWVGLICGPIIGILVTGGAACMLGRKLRGLAIVGSIAAMLPCGPCCLLGIPFGIWSLVVLQNADVADAFT